MFDVNELEMIENAIALKIASAKRGYNSATEPEFKEVFTLQQNRYNALLVKVQQEMSNAGKAQKDK
jgi:hypothetical protein